jgi:hypothetical protein
MEEAIKQIWDTLGIPPLWAAVLTICVLVIVYLAKRLMDQRANKEIAEHGALIHQFADIGEFSKEESVALTKAYLRIFEGKDSAGARGRDFTKIVAQADNELMAPLRKYQAKLDDETKAKIFFVHNILAQYYPDATDAAIEGFKRRKSEFYAHIDAQARRHAASFEYQPRSSMLRVGLVCQDQIPRSTRQADR